MITEFGTAALRNLHISKPFMPPFIGSDADQDDLVNFAETLLPTTGQKH